MAIFADSSRLSALTAAVLLSTACAGGKPTLQETRELTLDVNPSSTLFIEAGAGPLTLVGDNGNSVRVEASIYQRSPNDDYQLSLQADGEEVARLVAQASSAGFGQSDYIELAILVPRSMQVSLDDGSGSIRISELDGDLDIVDGSGSLGIMTIGGNVSIEDGSGSVSVQQVGGDVRIEDGSGSITVSDVTGTVRISDGSGSITVMNAGDFELIDDGSGSVNLEGIGSRSSSQ